MSEGVGVSWPSAEFSRSYLPHLKSRPPATVSYASGARGIDYEFDGLLRAERFYADKVRRDGFIDVDSSVEPVDACLHPVGWGRWTWTSQHRARNETGEWVANEDEYRNHGARRRG